MKSRWLILFILASIHFTNIVDTMIIMPMGDIFISTFDISSTQYSLLVSSYAFAAFISSLLGMFFLDRFNRKKALLYVYLGFTLGTLLCALANGYYFLITCRLFTGMFGGVLGAIVMALVTDLYPFKERGQAIGILMSAFSAASALGVPIGLYLATNINYHAPFYAIAAVAAVFLGMAYFLLPPIENEIVYNSPLKTITTILKDKNQTTALSSSMLLVLAHFMIIPFITPYMVRNVGFTQDQIALIFLIGGIATVFTGPFIGRMTDKFGVMQVLITLMIISIIPTIAITHMGSQAIWFALIFTTLFFIFGSGRFIPANTLITASVGPETRGSFMSLRSAVGQLSIAMSSAISGLIVFIGPNKQIIQYEYAAYLAIIIGAVAILAVSKIKVAKGN